MGALVAALSLVWFNVALGNQPLQMEVALKNAFRDGDRYYFDLYVQQIGQQPILLAFSDLSFDVQPNNASMSMHYLPGSANLVSPSGLPVVYNEQFSVQLLRREGQMIGMINADAPLHVSASNYQYKVAQIDGRELQHRLGRFYLANFQGDINDFDIELRLQAASSNSKVFGFDPFSLQALPVELSYSKPVYGEQQVVRSMNLQLDAAQIDISWESAFEQNVLGYRIQKSNDGMQWELVQDVAARNDQQARQLYHVHDANQAQSQARVYYRIQAISQEGVLFESPAKEWVLRNEISFKVYPNPARDLVNVRFSQLDANQAYELRVFDGLGKMVYKQVYESFAQPVLDVNVFAAGAYFVQVEQGGQQSVQRLVVVR
jgi:hypothetical protein